MSLRLILMRHAKSAWDDPGLSDHARPLNDRGRRSAVAIGNWLREHGYLPDLVLSSDATRTRETFEGLGLAQGLDAEVRFLRELYLAPTSRMLQVLQQAGDANTVLMLGHNPGIGDLASRLGGSTQADPDFDRYPTGATAIFDFAIGDWSRVEAAQAALTDFTVPRRLF